MSLNILFLGGAKRVSIAQHFIQYGAFRGIAVNIFSYELNNKVPIAEVGKVICGLKWDDKFIIKDLLKVINDNDIKIVLPFVDSAIAIAGTIKNELRNVFIPVSDESLCNIMFDKCKATLWFQQYDICQPKFYDTLSDIEYPIILKPRRGSASKGIVICRNSDDLPQSKIDDYLIQEYIANHTEYSVDCYVSNDGRILSIVPRIRLETSGGEAVRSMTVYDELIIEQSSKILSQGKFRGPITIQFLKDKDDLYVMEINPRLGGGVVNSIGAGSNMISFIINEALGENVNPVYDWKAGVVMARYFKEVIFYADNY